MSLIYGMSGDTQGGVCLKKHLDYYVYASHPTGCTCHIVIARITEDLFLGTYVLPYKNVNKHYSININDESKCLILSGISINDWTENYINSLVTTGYTGYNGATTETRNIWEQSTNTYYLINQSISSICSGDTVSRWAIVDYITEEIWLSGSTDYFYNQTDSCGTKTGDRIVKIKDINPVSSTYNQTHEIIKCQTETAPIVAILNTNGITSTGAILNAEIVSDGGYDIIEKGFCYGRNNLPSINDNKIKSTTIGSQYSKTISGLTPGTKYYIRAYATNILGLTYSNTDTFQTTI
jgi:hypothetical protein